MFRIEGQCFAEDLYDGSTFSSDKNNVKISELKEKFNFGELSMGMSNDYIIAIKHGSTFLRIGSKIFGPRN